MARGGQHRFLVYNSLSVPTVGSWACVCFHAVASSVNRDVCVYLPYGSAIIGGGEWYALICFTGKV